MPQIISHHLPLHEHLATLRGQGQSIGFVPTMGALHAGHIALVNQAKAQCDVVVVSIFVNPKQFGQNEDFGRYPRPIEADLALLEQAQADIAYLPTAETMYPTGFSSLIHVSGISEGLCGAARPGHFDGVATVVCKLLLQTLAHRAYFGEKDYQQLQLIRRLVEDLNIPVDIIACATVREADGLALSSRNQYLSSTERATAPLLYATLQQTATRIKEGRTVEETLIFGRNQLEEGGFDRVDYLELRHAHTLVPMSAYTAPARLLVAAHLGRTRLIDNVAVE